MLELSSNENIWRSLLLCNVCLLAVAQCVRVSHSGRLKNTLDPFENRLLEHKKNENKSIRNEKQMMQVKTPAPHRRASATKRKIEKKKNSIEN